jgi:glucosylceramidase
VRDGVYGIGFHWYSGDHFENLRLCREFFPEKNLLFTEGCVELANDTSMSRKANSGSGGKSSPTESPWEFGECYGHDIMGDLSHGTAGYIDWNMLLDTTGGPNHVDNFCSAPIMCDAKNQKLFFQPSYYFIGHFSRYIPRGSRLIATSRYTDLFETAAFLTPDNKKVVVLINRNDESVPFSLKDVSTNRIADLSVSPKSITTLIYE